MVAARHQQHAGPGAGGAGAGDVGGGLPGVGDPVTAAVQDEDVSVPQLRDGLPGRAPGSEGHHAAYLRSVRGPQGGPAAHGVPQQDHRHVTDQFAQLGERPYGVRQRLRALAVPAAPAVAHLTQQHVVSVGP